MAVQRVPVPADALLAAYCGDGNHVDAYQLSVSEPVALPDYIRAFFQTGIFRLERWILAVAAGASSSDYQIEDLAKGQGDRMAAWRVEARGDQEILLAVEGSPIRTWLGVVSGPSPALLFGSAVLAYKGRVPFAARALMPFHAVYSRVLLASAGRNFP
ncbi:MAG: hypothetical protein AAF092_18555 [Pseudomonadota bacterium]